MKASLTRRGMLAGGMATGGALALGGCDALANTIAGELGGADHVRGHKLRDLRLPPPSGPVQQAGIVIAGGGIAGLAAGWTLAEAGFDDFVLLELEDSTGGNARAGKNQVSAYPLGAHYLPVPNEEARALRHMLQRFGMITGEADGKPVYDPYQLCADLEERLFWQGKWQEGLRPRTGLSDAENAQWTAFDARMDAFKHATGADGKPAFASPMAYSSTDAQFTDLDQQSFAQWLDAQGWTSEALRRYVRYCCRDDYGAEPDHVSAWAGVHYFAGRRGFAANDDGDRELTWPEGNGRLAALMAQPFKDRIRTGNSVFRATRDGRDVLLDSFDHCRERSSRTRTRATILAMPDFIATRVMLNKPAEKDHRMHYAPWIVANITIARRPRGKGVQLAWDNVSAGSSALGYVVATHQTQGIPDGPTVLTWYLALSETTPQQARGLMLERTLEQWQAQIEDDLLIMHPDLEGAILRIDVWRWGHAMVSPSPGFLTNAARTRATKAIPPLFRAHSDLSGLSLFEEAHYRGVVAAEQAMRHLGHPFESRI
jgi:monoamine oxidase